MDTLPLQFLHKDTRFSSIRTNQSVPEVLLKHPALKPGVSSRQMPRVEAERVLGNDVVVVHLPVKDNPLRVYTRIDGIGRVVGYQMNETATIGKYDISYTRTADIYGKQIVDEILTRDHTTKKELRREIIDRGKNTKLITAMTQDGQHAVVQKYFSGTDAPAEETIYDAMGRTMRERKNIVYKKFHILGKEPGTEILRPVSERREQYHQGVVTETIEIDYIYDSHGQLIEEFRIYKQGNTETRQSQKTYEYNRGKIAYIKEQITEMSQSEDSGSHLKVTQHNISVKPLDDADDQPERSVKDEVITPEMSATRVHRFDANFVRTEEEMGSWGEGRRHYRNIEYDWNNNQAKITDGNGTTVVAINRELARDPDILFFSNDFYDGLAPITPSYREALAA